MVKPVAALPERKRGSVGIDWKVVTAEVEALGGEWAEVGVFSPSVASHIRSGRYPSVDPTKFEVTTQKADQPGRSYLFMRLRVSS